MKSLTSLYLFTSILAIINLCVCAQTSHAATFYVATNGNDVNPGTAAAPFRTLLKGVRVLSAGDTLIVKGGTYVEGLANIPSGRVGAPTTVQVASGEQVILQSPSSSLDTMLFFPNGTSYVTVDGFILDANNLTAFGVANSDSTTTHHLIMKNLEVKNARNSGVLINGSNLELRNLHIHHNGRDPRFDHGIYFQGDHSLLIGNIIHDNQCYGIQNYSSTGANPTDNTYLQNIIYNQICGGLTLPMGANHLVANNVIYNASTEPQGGALLCCGPNTKIYNNTIYNSAGSGLTTVGNGNDVGAQVKNNIVYNNGGGNIRVVNATQSNNLTTNPGFVDAARGNFHLTAGSAAINAGVTLSQVEVDYDNVPRPQGASYDIGAYEYRMTSVSTSVPAPRNLRAVIQP